MESFQVRLSHEYIRLPLLVSLFATVLRQPTEDKVNTEDNIANRERGCLRIPLETQNQSVLEDSTLKLCCNHP